MILPDAVTSWGELPSLSGRDSQQVITGDRYSEQLTCWKGLGLEKISTYIHNKSISINTEDTFESSKSSYNQQNRHFIH